MSQFEEPKLIAEIEKRFKEISALVEKEAGAAPTSIEIEFPQPLEQVAVDSSCEVVGQGTSDILTFRSSCVFIWKWVLRNGRLVRVRCKVN